MLTPEELFARSAFHAKNLAEQIIYIVKGTDVRHNPISDVESLVR